MAALEKRAIKCEKMKIPTCGATTWHPYYNILHQSTRRDIPREQNDPVREGRYADLCLCTPQYYYILPLHNTIPNHTALPHSSNTSRRKMPPSSSRDGGGPCPQPRPSWPIPSHPFPPVAQGLLRRLAREATASLTSVAAQQMRREMLAVGCSSPPIT